MKTLKHIGKIKNTGAKVIVVFRTLPGESNNSLILSVNQLPDMYHDSIMNFLETDMGQEAFEFGEAMFSRPLPDGRPMLQAMQQDGRLIKMPTDNIIMTPTTTSEISLDELNLLIAEQRNVPVDELYTFVKGAKKLPEDKEETTNQLVDTEVEQPVIAESVEPLSDKDLAKSYRSQADAMYKEAARLRRQADELDPPQKKPVNKKETESA